LKRREGCAANIGSTLCDTMTRTCKPARHKKNFSQKIFNRRSCPKRIPILYFSLHLAISVNVTWCKRRLVAAALSHTAGFCKQKRKKSLSLDNMLFSSCLFLRATLSPVVIDGTDTSRNMIYFNTRRAFSESQASHQRIHNSKRRNPSRTASISFIQWFLTRCTHS